MPTLPLIKDILLQRIDLEYPQEFLFVFIDNQVQKYLVKDIDKIDRDYYFVEMNSLYNIPVISRKLK